LVAQVDKTAEQRLIAPLINDPSLELRRDAIVLALKAADARLAAGEKKRGIQDYQRVFHSSRDLDQIKVAAAKLRELDQSVDLPRHMGFVLRWNVAGPFDNTDGIGFDKVYPPENGVDLDATYAGKVGPTRWQTYVTKDDFGIVDLNDGFKRPEVKKGTGFEFTDAHTGVVAYAYTVFDSAESRSVDFRIGCINANKLWLNGVLLTANQIYHSGMEVDQYVATGNLKRGRNTLLVKVVQNEQKEDWAQRWQFQLRICDELGTAVLSRNRDRQPSETP